MFILYDENMQEIQYPEGLLPLDIFVSSLQKDVETETVPGVPGHILYGATHQQRTVELTMWLKSKDSTDYRLLRNEIYALFDTGQYMYVAEENVPSRVLKILIDNAYTPSRLTSTVAEVTISARTLDEVYWQSRYTTLELHDSGYSAGSGTVPSGLTSSNYQTLFGSVGNSQLLASDIQKLERDLNVLKRNVGRYEGEYGLVDGIDDEKVKYRFTDSNFTLYNFGNVTVEPESMMLNITIGLVENTETFKLENKTTGDVFEINKHLNGRNIYLRGVSVTEGGATNILRETNKRFISLAPGNNEFEITGGTFSQISFDFRGYYK